MADNDAELVLEELTPRQKCFVAEYLIDLNATKAAIRAGYNPNSASVTASDMLAKANIAAMVARAMEQRASRVQMTADSVLHEMSLLSHSNIDHYIVDDDGRVVLTEGAPDGAMAAVQSVRRKKTIREDKDGNCTVTYDVEIKLWDKPTPLKLMGRHTGLFPDRMEHTGKNGGPIETVSEIKRTIVRPGDAPTK